MTYQCGIGNGLQELGFQPREPRIRCDGYGCQATVDVTTRFGLPAKWFLARRAPPRWKSQRHDDGTGNDFCSDCVAAGRARYLKSSMRLEAFYYGPTLVYGFAVTTAGEPRRSDGVPRRSYEVHAGTETGTTWLRSFLYLDLGEKNRDLALAWAEGYARAQVENREKP